ncbi:F-box protein At5g49610-like [Salvia miltiorrhiza]|uniref:F-box protein At5g49610-like n=1 Tax=Salvia miltiorrhiza TaxID=226208 RepID=UPI0025AC9F30|nr:F-box protein At5g49610-like [Salvia miltiorrhiza]
MKKMKGHWFANDDIPMNILSRLSTKTLHLFKSVSKDWLNLISDRSFISLQLKRSEPVSGFYFQEVFQWTDDEYVDQCISYINVGVERVNVWCNVLDFLPDNVVVLSLNNGLLCCRTSFPNSHPMIYVCNPLNKQWRSLMWPNNIAKDCSIALAFDPFRDPIDVSTDFKLVAVSRIEEGYKQILVEEDEEEEEEEEYSFFFDIYSSKTRSWRRSKECCKCNHELTKNRGVLADGILYWLVGHGYGILMFDLQNELSWLIPGPLPSAEFTCTPEMCIGESQDKLCYVIISEHGMQLWILEDQFAPKWDLKFHASLDELEGENIAVLYNLEEKIRSRLSRDVIPWMDPLSFKDGVVLLRVSAAVYLYEFGTRRRMKKLCDVSTLGPKAMFSPIVVPYTMSLVPVEQA